jgi:hypothetical protein
MKYSKDKLLNIAINKLKTLGFVNVTKTNIFEDEVYKYHFKIFMKSIIGKNEDTDQIIFELFSTIDKNGNE